MKRIQKAEEIPVPKFLSYASNRWGIRRTTTLEYLEDWCDGEYVSINNNVIKFLKKPEWWNRSPYLLEYVSVIVDVSKCVGVY